MTGVGVIPVLRTYEHDECGADGYPTLWHRGIVLCSEGPYVLAPDVAAARGQHSIGIKDLVRQAASERCARFPPRSCFQRTPTGERERDRVDALRCGGQRRGLA